MRELFFLRKVHCLLVAIVLTGAVLACNGEPGGPEPTLDISLEPTRDTVEWDRTAYGFFPSPPEASLESVLGHFEALGEHADFILIQPNIPWEDFVNGVEGESQARTDLRNQIILARRNSVAAGTCLPRIGEPFINVADFRRDRDR